MATVVHVPYARIEVEYNELKVRLNHEPEEITSISELDIQLRQSGFTQHGICIMTTHTPGVMWLHGVNLFYRLLFTINEPVGDGFTEELFRYEVKVYRDRLDIIAGWSGDEVFPILATVYYHEVREFDACPLFTEEVLLPQS